MKIKKFILFLLFPYLLVLVVGLSLYRGSIFNYRLLQFQFVLAGGTISVMFAVSRLYKEPVIAITSLIIMILNVAIYSFDPIGSVYSILLVGFIYTYFKFIEKTVRKWRIKLFKYLIFAILLSLAVVIKGILILLITKMKPASILPNLTAEILYVFIIGFVSAIGFDISLLLEGRYIVG